MNQEQEAALSYCQQAISLKNDLERNFLDLGAYLTRIHDEQLYLGQYGEWGLFLEEMRMTESVASRLMTVHKYFILKYGIEKEKLLQIGGWSEAYQISRLKGSREEVLALLDTMSHMNKKDREAELAEAKTGIRQEDCNHEKAYTIRYCPVCKMKTKVYDED